MSNDTLTPATTGSSPVVNTAVEAAPAVNAAVVETPVISAPEPAPAVVSTPESPVEVVAAPTSETPAAVDALGGTGEEPVKAKPEEIKPADAKPGEVKESTAKTDAEPAKAEGDAAPLPVFEDFKFPDGVKVDKAPLENFTKLLGEFELGKLDHKAFQEKGQALVDMHVQAVKDTVDRLNDYYVQLHENQKTNYFEAFKADPEIGGPKIQETVASVRNAVDNFGGNETQIGEFRQLMKDTGIGSHPALVRLINNMQAKINKYTTEQDTNAQGTRIVPGSRPAPSKAKPYQQFYGNGSKQS